MCYGQIFFFSPLSLFAFESLFFSLVSSLFFRSSPNLKNRPNQASKAKANHGGSLSISFPISFLVQTLNQSPWIFSLSLQVPIEMILLGLQFMIGGGFRLWWVCWVWVCILWSGWGAGAFVGFGFLGFDWCVCWFWFCRLQLTNLLVLGLVFLVRCLCKKWTQTRRIWRWNLEGCYTEEWRPVRNWRWDLKLWAWGAEEGETWS